MNQLGKKIREIREKKKLLLRQVAASLETDTALISKVERGERNLSREQVERLARLFQVKVDDLITLWLADKVISVIGNDPLGKKGIRKALNELTQ